MNPGVKKSVLVLTMVCSSLVFSQDLSFSKIGFFKDEYNLSYWATSADFDGKNSANLQTFAIPFTFPAEASLYTTTHNSHEIVDNSEAGKTIPATYKISKLAPDISAILAYEDKSVPNLYSAKRIYASSLSPFVGYGRGIMYMYLKKNMGLNFDLSLRLAGNLANHVIAESMNTNLTFSYKIANNLFSYFHNTKMNLFLQISEDQKFNLYDSRSEFSHFKRAYKVKPGFSVYTDSIVFEGLLNFELDDSMETVSINKLMKQEVSGSIGLKWFIPDN